MKKVSLISDGSCLGNPGPGGWACVLRFGAAQKELFGFDPKTTNNRMELMAVIQGMLALREPCDVEVVSDSQYVIRGITQSIGKWKRRHWWRKRGPVPNVDLWLELDALVAEHKTSWVWTKGHADHEDNSRCDWLAQQAAANQRSSWEDGRPHAPTRLGLDRDYVPPKPQAGLFEDSAMEDDDDDE